jgi:hypothetical protein
MSSLCCCVDTKLSALAQMTQSRKLLSREAHRASGKDSLNAGRGPKDDPCLLSNSVRLPALTDFLPYVSCNSLNHLANPHSSQSISVRTFADRVDSCVVGRHNWFQLFKQGRDLVSQGN